MTAKKKTWTEKMNPDMEPKVKKVENDFADIPAGATMLIATPNIVADYIRHIPKGTAATLQQMRNDLAAEYNAEFMCPVTAGIFLRIVAESAYEEYLQGKPVNKIIPFWRMIDKKSPAIKKLSFGADFVIEQRTKEKIPA